MKKHTYEYVYNYFKENNCELISKEYIGIGFKLNYVCECGNLSSISFDHFRGGRRCNICGINKRKQKTSHTYEYVYNIFNKNGCELISNEYINSKQLLDYKCSCGNYAKISFNAFQKGQRCILCKDIKIGNSNRKYSYEYVYNYFKNSGCELLSKDYKSTNILLDYRCSCGNISQIQFAHFKNRHRCFECGILKTANARRYTLEYIKDYFDKHGCKLLSTKYISSDILLDYVCECGNISKINFNNFKNGSRCAKCIESKGEKRIRTYLDLNDIIFIPQKKFDNLLGLGNRNLSYDFYLPDYNLLIEYQGQFHDGTAWQQSKEDFEKQQEHDKRKKEYAQKNNINLLEIWYWDFDNIEQILEQQLNLLKVVV